nr:hypothetical protein F39B3.2 - Caenorhabditis elegans [Caenorhabditis elegans]
MADATTASPSTTFIAFIFDWALYFIQMLSHLLNGYFTAFFVFTGKIWTTSTHFRRDKKHVHLLFKDFLKNLKNFKPCFYHFFFEILFFKTFCGNYSQFAIGVHISAKRASRNTCNTILFVYGNCAENEKKTSSQKLKKKLLQSTMFANQKLRQSSILFENRKLKIQQSLETKLKKIGYRFFCNDLFATIQFLLKNVWPTTFKMFYLHFQSNFQKSAKADDSRVSDGSDVLNSKVFRSSRDLNM